MSKLKIIALLTAIFVSSCGRADVSGEYLARFTNGIYHLQLLKTSDDKLTGQLDTIVRDKDNKLTYLSFTASGVADGRSVSLTFSTPGILSSHLSASGALDGSALSLTGNLNPNLISTVVFNRVAREKYKTDVDAFLKETESLIAQKLTDEMKQEAIQAQGRFVFTVDRLIASAQKFTAEAAPHLDKWPLAEDRFRSITTQMSANLGRQKSLDRDRFAVQRGQINVAINQAALVSEQAHSEVEKLQSTFDANVTPLNTRISNTLRACRSLGEASTFNVKTACSRLDDTALKFDETYRAISRGLARMETVYQEEKRKQDSVVRESDNAN